MELRLLFAQQEYDVILLQELKASQTGDTVFDGYTTFKRERTQERNTGPVTQGGGIATLVRTKLTATQKYTAPHASVTERLDVEVEGVLFVNLYRPCGTESADDQRTDGFDVDTLPSTGKVVIAGDVNAHHHTWDSYVKGDKLGKTIYLWTLEHKFKIANDPAKATRLRVTTRSSPDVVLTSKAVPLTNWDARAGGTSDHIAVEFTVLCKTPTHTTQPPTAKRKTWNWKRADWPRFTAMLEASTAATLRRSNCNDTYCKWLGMVKKAAEACIPKKRRTKRKKRWFSGDTKRAIRQRDQELARQLAATTITTQDAAYLKQLRQEATKLIREAKRRTWVQHCEKASAAKDLSDTFDLIRSLDGRSKKPSGVPLHLDGKPLTDPCEKANAMAEHLAQVSRGQRADPTPRRQTKRVVTDFSPGEAEFTRCELQTAIDELEQKKSPGQDEVYNEWLQHLGERAQAALLHVCNLSWTTATLPEAWTTATVIPAHKPGRDPTHPASYRPISLTSGVSKVMEKMVKRRMHQLMDAPNTGVKKLHSAQAGFRPLRGTTDQLQYIVQNVSNTLSSKRCGVLLTCDMDKAFDRVSREKIKTKINTMGFPPRYYNWLSSYLSNRSYKVRVEGHLGDRYTSEDGVPQGTVLAPLLFNLVMDQLADSLSSMGPDVKPALFADDVAILVVGDSLSEALQLAQTVLGVVEAFCTDTNLLLSPSKTTWTHIAARKTVERTDTSELPQLVYANGTPIAEEPNPRYLGVVLDSTCLMAAHADLVMERFSKRLNILHQLAGTDWGCDAHTLRAAYLCYVYPTVTYAASVYGERIPTKVQEELENLHRKAAKVITGCDYMTTKTDLYWEAQLSTVSSLFTTAAADDLEKFMRVEDSPGRAAATSTKLPGGCSWLAKAMETVEETGAYRHSIRAPLLDHDPVAPWEWDRMLNDVLITPEIPGVSKSDSTSSEENRQRTELALAALPPHTGRVYTDGSLHTVDRTPRASLTTRPAHPQGGAGAIFYHNDGSTTPARAHQASSGAGTLCARPIRQSWWHYA